MTLRSHPDQYVERWFWTLEGLAARVGLDRTELLPLLSAGCGAGPVYVLKSTGEWWSALDGGTPPQGQSWYSRASVWGLRRAALRVRQGMSPDEAASAERDAFVTQFVAALGSIEDAESAFGDCFSDGAVDPISARVRAGVEWAAWIDGGYGVCLRIFTARTCVEKEVLGASLKLAVDQETSDAIGLLRHAETLAGLMLPFAPWQRNTCTPGRTIDPLLHKLRLGEERPYN